MFQINTCNKQFIYKPYPVGNLINLIDPKIYDKLVEEFRKTYLNLKKIWVKNLVSQKLIIVKFTLI